ncbi:MAG TPA: zinc finger Ran-binding domain-containing protein, partial [Pyrinomonadaceae bacterium]
MNNTKCPRCGLVNWSGDEVCERCGAPLAGGDPEARAPEAARPDTQGLTLGSDVPTGSRTWKPVLLILVVVALGGAALAVYKWRAGAGRRSVMVQAMRKEMTPPSLDERTRD